ncbi:MAG: ammonium transporter [Geminicoccaceae bacterium]
MFKIARRLHLVSLSSFAAFAFAFWPIRAFSQEGAPQLSDGDTAWIITATALVLFMTLPGLALFYGGLVRARNLLSVLMHCFSICCVVSVLWLAIAYSLTFGEGNAVIGGLGRVFLSGVGTETLAGAIPEVVFFMFQMTFAIITPALIVGAYAERITFPAVLLFSSIWLLLVYAPVAHWIWGGGWLAALGVMDFAGGLVVHLTAGASALVLALVIGRRRGFPHDAITPHSPGLTMAGAAMLWVGWFGFNGGSALAANGNAGMAIAVTHVAAATGALTWAAVEWIKYGKPSLVGAVTGMVAGLASITPASGFVGPIGALIIGLVGGYVCQWVTAYLKQVRHIDDSLDVFAVHGVGGILGTLLTAFLAVEALGGLGIVVDHGVLAQFGVQLMGVVVVGVWSAALTYGIVKVVGAMVPLRVSEVVELEGLDVNIHGERAYDL